MTKNFKYNHSSLLVIFLLWTALCLIVGFTSVCSSMPNVISGGFGRIPVGTMLGLNDEISSITVQSKEECVMRCFSHQECQTILLEETSGDLSCIMKSNVTSSYLAMDSGTVGYALLWKSSDTDQGVIHTTQTTSAVPTSTIVDMVQGVFTNKCTSFSQADFLVITHQGLFFYDDYTSLTSGPCLYEPNYGATFYGFGNLPDVTQWEAVMAFQNYWVDVYTGGEVYRWQNVGNYLSKITAYPKSTKSHIQYITSTKSHIQYITSTSISITPMDLVWAVNRKDTGGDLVYYYDGTQYYLYNNQNPKQRVFLQNATDVIDQNSRDLNIWKDLPSNVVGLTAVDNSGAEFVYVTWPDMLHYKLDRHGQIHNLGQIKLS